MGVKHYTANVRVRVRIDSRQLRLWIFPSQRAPRSSVPGLVSATPIIHANVLKWQIRKVAASQRTFSCLHHAVSPISLLALFALLRAWGFVSFFPPASANHDTLPLADSAEEIAFLVWQFADGHLSQISETTVSWFWKLTATFCSNQF